MDNYKQLLDQLIALKSVSTDARFADNIKETAQWLIGQFKQNNFETTLYEGYGNPVVFAEYIVSPDVKTVLIYGHYDVQPAKLEDGWDSDPFTLLEREGKLYGRGVVDNKGQLLIHIASVFDLIKKSSLKYNVKFLIEGNEETGSEDLDKLIEKESEKMACDYIMISDGELPYKPVLTASFRGTFNATIELKTADNSLHSGLYGGAAPNAAIELSKLIAKMYDENNKITIPDFYKGTVKVSEDELLLCKKMDIEKVETLKSTRLKKLFKGYNDSFCETLGFNTMFTVSGFKSGYVEDGYSNIVPATAIAKVNFRIAAGQKAQDLLQLFEAFVRKNVPEYVEVNIVNVTRSVDAIKVDISSPIHQETIALLGEVYKEDVLIDFCGASIPIVVAFQEILGVDPLLVSLGNDDCNMHGVNENFDVGLIEKGLEFSRRFFSK